MSLEKTEVKRLIAQNIGKKINLFEEKNQKELNQMDGALLALNSISQKIKNFKNEEINEIIEIQKHHFLAQKNQNIGKKSAYENCITICEKIFLEEEQKAEMLLKAIEDNERVVGTHPGEPIAKKRKKNEQNAR